MIYDIEITEKAENDLKEIYKYIAEILLVENTALNQIERLEERILSLNQNPLRFRRYSKEDDLRFVAVGNYIIFYIVDRDKKIVSIVRVLYGGQNISEQLNKH